jgi:hypothetical protein
MMYEQPCTCNGCHTRDMCSDWLLLLLLLLLASLSLFDDDTEINQTGWRLAAVARATMMSPWRYEHDMSCSASKYACATKGLLSATDEKSRRNSITWRSRSILWDEVSAKTRCKVFFFKHNLYLTMTTGVNCICFQLYDFWLRIQSKIYSSLN